MRKIKKVINDYFKKQKNISTISTSIKLEPELIPPEFQGSSKLRDEPILTKIIKQLSAQSRLPKDILSFNDSINSSKLPSKGYEEEQESSFYDSRSKQESSLKTFKISTFVKKEDRAIMKLPDFLEKMKRKEVERIFEKFSTMFVSKRELYSMFIMLKILIGTQQAYNKAKKVLYKKYVNFVSF